MDSNSQQMAQDILNAMSSSGRTDVPVVDHPGALSADADEKARASWDRHYQAHVAHLNNKPAGQLTQAERTTLAQATLAGLREDGYCR